MLTKGHLSHNLWLASSLLCFGRQYSTLHLCFYCQEAVDAKNPLLPPQNQTAERQISAKQQKKRTDLFVSGVTSYQTRAPRGNIRLRFFCQKMKKLTLHVLKNTQHAFYPPRELKKKKNLWILLVWWAALQLCRRPQSRAGLERNKCFR